MVRPDLYDLPELLRDMTLWYAENKYSVRPHTDEAITSWIQNLTDIVQAMREDRGEIA